MITDSTQVSIAQQTCCSNYFQGFSVSIAELTTCWDCIWLVFIFVVFSHRVSRNYVVLLKFRWIYSDNSHYSKYVAECSVFFKNSKMIKLLHLTIFSRLTEVKVHC